EMPVKASAKREISEALNTFFPYSRNIRREFTAYGGSRYTKLPAFTWSNVLVKSPATNVICSRSLEQRRRSSLEKYWLNLLPIGTLKCPSALVRYMPLKQFLFR